MNYKLTTVIFLVFFFLILILYLFQVGSNNSFSRQEKKQMKMEIKKRDSIIEVNRKMNAELMKKDKLSAIRIESQSKFIDSIKSVDKKIQIIYKERYRNIMEMGEDEFIKHLKENLQDI